MADENTPQDPAGETPPAAQEKAETPPWGEDFDPARAWQTIQKLRAREQELEPLAKKARELEDASKTEQQRLEERAAAAERERDEMRAEALRLRIAADKGLTPKQAARLRGSSEEELLADADELLSEFGASGPRRPTGDVGQGPRDTPQAPTDPKTLADAVLARRGH